MYHFILYDCISKFREALWYSPQILPRNKCFASLLSLQSSTQSSHSFLFWHMTCALSFSSTDMCHQNIHIICIPTASQFQVRTQNTSEGSIKSFTFDYKISHAYWVWMVEYQELQQTSWVLIFARNLHVHLIIIMHYICMYCMR